MNKTKVAIVGIGNCASSLVQGRRAYEYGNSPVRGRFTQLRWYSHQCHSLPQAGPGQGGILHSPSAYLMKHPPVQYTDDEAYQMVKTFVAGKRDI